jgi:methyl coenzyme M reductase subunit C
MIPGTQELPRPACGDRAGVREVKLALVRLIILYSASGCPDGWASAKAGMAMQVSQMRMTRG